MFRVRKLILYAVFLLAAGEAHCPSTRITADATKRRNDTAERAKLVAIAERMRRRRELRRDAGYVKEAREKNWKENEGGRMAAGAERRRAKNIPSYAEKNESGEDGGSADGDEYLPSQQIKRRKYIEKRKTGVGSRTSGEGASKKRKTTTAKKEPVSKKRGRPTKSTREPTDGVTASESISTTPKRRGRKPKTAALVEVEKASK